MVVGGAVGVAAALEEKEIPGRGMDHPARSRDRLSAAGAASAAGMVAGDEGEEGRARVASVWEIPGCGMDHPTRHRDRIEAPAGLPLPLGCLLCSHISTKVSTQFDK